MGWNIRHLNRTTNNQPPRLTRIARGRIRLTALEVIRGIDTLVGLSELRVTEDPTCGVTLITQNALLPFVRITLVRSLAGAAGGASTLSVTLLQRGTTNAFPVVLRVPVRAVEVTRIVLAANRGRMVGVVAVLSALLDLHMWESADGEMLRQYL